MKVFIKVPIEKQLPKTERKVFTDLGMLTFYEKEKFFLDVMYSIQIPSWWLKEVEIPDDVQMWNDAANHGNEVWGEYSTDVLNDYGGEESLGELAANDFMSGANYILNKLK